MNTPKGGVADGVVNKAEARDNVAKTRKSLRTASNRLLIVGNFLSDSVGTRWTCEELALRLRQAGWNVTTTSNRRPRVARLLDMVTTTWRHRHEYDIAQIDVYSGLSFVWAEVVGALLELLAKPYAVTLHGGSLPEFSAGRKKRVGRFLQSASLATSPSLYIASKMAAYRDDIQWVPNAIDLSRYHFEQRRNLQPSLVWLRAFHPIYNPGIVPDIVKLLRSDYPEVVIKMVGPVKNEECLKDMLKKADELGVADHIHIVGAVQKEDVPSVLADADIFVNTTNFDNAPVSVLEAMACGLCIVSTDVGGMPYLITHEENGLLVPPDEPVAMSQAIRRLLSEPELSGKICANARRKAEQHSWTRLLPQWERLLASMMND